MFMRVEESERGCRIAQSSPNAGVAPRWTHRTEGRSACPLLFVAASIITQIVSAITHEWMIFLTRSSNHPQIPDCILQYGSDRRCLNRREETPSPFA
jgi:hypothetical protein